MDKPKPLSRTLKKRIADFHKNTSDIYWWRTPEYLELAEAITKERTGA